MRKLEKLFFDSYSAYSDELFKFILFKLSDREKTKDVLQNVYMKTWLYISRNGKIKNMRAFLYKTSSNAVIDEYRKQSKIESRVESLETLNEEFGFDPPLEDMGPVMDSIDGAQAVELIKELPEIYSEVLFLRYVQNQEISEIANAIGESKNTISVRLNRGIKKLKEIITQRNNGIF